jgi:exonuclease III
MGMLADFIRKQDEPRHDMQTGYETHMNIGTSMRGTAIMAKSQHHLTNIRKLPTGRAIAAIFRDVQIINLYAPSGTNRRAEREEFYNMELTHILQDTNTHILIAGDFNCVQQTNDTTGHFNTSRVLQEIIRGMALKDAWTQNPQKPSYIHYTTKSASRHDRPNKKTGNRNSSSRFHRAPRSSTAPLISKYYREKSRAPLEN